MGLISQDRADHPTAGYRARRPPGASRWVKRLRCNRTEEGPVTFGFGPLA